jgi:hypothetical protein
MIRFAIVAALALFALVVNWPSIRTTFKSRVFRERVDGGIRLRDTKTGLGFDPAGRRRSSSSRRTILGVLGARLRLRAASRAAPRDASSYGVVAKAASRDVPRQRAACVVRQGGRARGAARASLVDDPGGDGRRSRTPRTRRSGNGDRGGIGAASRRCSRRSTRRRPRSCGASASRR